MKTFSAISFLALAAALSPGSALACAACYGQSDSPMAKGMNWGILSLLGTIVLVLGAIASFFIFLARRQAAGALQPATPRQPAGLNPALANDLRPQEA